MPPLMCRWLPKLDMCSDITLQPRVKAAYVIRVSDVKHKFTQIYSADMSDRSSEGCGRGKQRLDFSATWRSSLSEWVHLRSPPGYASSAAYTASGLECPGCILGPRNLAKFSQ